MDGVKPMASFDECIGKKIKEVQRMNREYRKDEERYRQELFAADAVAEPVVEGKEVGSLEITDSRVFGRQGIIYVEKDENPETVKWYFERGKMKFNTELSEEDLVAVIGLALSRR